MKALISIVLLTATMHSCSNWVEGNGNVITETYPLDKFDKIDLEGTGHVYLKQGNKNELVVEMDENLFEYFHFANEGGELRIKFSEMVKSAEKIDIYITAKDVNEIDLSGVVSLNTKEVLKTKELSIEGSGGVELNLELDVDELDLDLSGAADVFIEGEANSAKIDISGAGELDAYDFKTKKMLIDISGAGSAEVFVSERLDAEISGAGSINYKGNPTKIAQDISGAGSIKAR